MAASCFQAAKKFGEALKHLDAALEKSPRHGLLLKTRGDMLFQLERKGQAADAYLAAILSGALLGAALWHWMGPARQTGGQAGNDVSRFTITVPDDLELNNVQISADGRTTPSIMSSRP